MDLGQIKTTEKCNDLQNVRDRLLDAAESLFCERGYDGVSVRDLTAQADCNVSAVNYYFGGKEHLYLEMFRRQIKAVFERNLSVIEAILSEPDATLEQLLGEIIAAPLNAVFENQPGLQVMRLMVGEVLHKKVQTEQIIGQFKSKMLEGLKSAFVRLVPGLSEERAKLAVFSIDAMVIHPLLFLEFYLKMIPDLKQQELVEHIVRFAAAGIRSFVGDTQR